MYQTKYLACLCSTVNFSLFYFIFSRLAVAKRPINTPVGISPGQQVINKILYYTFSVSVYGSIAQVQVERVSHLISHPSHPLTRHMLTTHYGLPSSEAQSSKIKGGQGQVVTGSTVEPLTALPRANRRDAQVRERGPFKSLENSVLAQ